MKRNEKWRRRIRLEDETKRSYCLRNFHSEDRQGIICNDLSLRVTRTLLTVNTKCTTNFRFPFSILQPRKVNGFT